MDKSISSPTATATKAPEQPVPEAAVGQEKFLSIAEQIERGTRKRVPLSTAVQKLMVDAIPGYYLYWFKESNLPAALDAGYEFCQRDQHHVNQLGVGIERGSSGSRVSIMGSLTSSPTGGPERAYLMKLRQEWRDEDKAQIDAKNATIMQGIFKDEKIGAPEGSLRDKGSLEYVRTALFNRPVRKAKIAR